MKILSAITSPGPRSGGRSISRGYLALFATVIIWSLPSLFQFYLLRYSDVWAQNFYRYRVACIAIAPFVAFRIRRGGPQFDLRAFALCLIPAVPNVVHQITQTIALFYSGPGVYAIFTRSSVIMTALLALIFFRKSATFLGNGNFKSAPCWDYSAQLACFGFNPGLPPGTSLFADC